MEMILKAVVYTIMLAVEFNRNTRKDVFVDFIVLSKIWSQMRR